MVEADAPMIADVKIRLGRPFEEDMKWQNRNNARNDFEYLLG